MLRPLQTPWRKKCHTRNKYLTLPKRLWHFNFLSLLISEIWGWSQKHSRGHVPLPRPLAETNLHPKRGYSTFCRCILKLYQWRRGGVCAQGKRLCCRPSQSAQFCNQGIFQDLGHELWTNLGVSFSSLFSHYPFPLLSSPLAFPFLTPSPRSKVGPLNSARSSGERQYKSCTVLQQVNDQSDHQCKFLGVHTALCGAVEHWQLRGVVPNLGSASEA